MTTAKVVHPIFTGKAYMATWVDGQFPAHDQYHYVGLCSKGEFTIADQKIELADTESVTGGIADSHIQVKSVGLKWTLQRFNQANMALAMFGTAAVTPEQTVRERFVVTVPESNNMLGFAPSSVEIFTENYTPNSLTLGVLADHNQIILTAKKGLAPKVAFIQPDSANLTTTVSVTGQTITVLLKYDGTAITATVNDVVAVIQASVSASQLVAVAIAPGSNGTALVAAAAEQVLSGQVGQYFSNPFDYTVKGGMLSATPNSTIPLNTPLIAEMVIPETIRVSGASEITPPVSIIIEQTDAKSGKNMRLFMPKVQFSPAAKLVIFAEKAQFADLDLTGDVQKFTDLISHEMLNPTSGEYEQVPYGTSQYFYYDL